MPPLQAQRVQLPGWRRGRGPGQLQLAPIAGAGTLRGRAYAQTNVCGASIVLEVPAVVQESVGGPPPSYSM